MAAQVRVGRRRAGGARRGVRPRAPAPPAALGHGRGRGLARRSPATTSSPTRCTRPPTPSPSAPPPTTSGRGWSRSGRTAAASTPTTRSRTSSASTSTAPTASTRSGRTWRSARDFVTLDPDETLKMTIAVLGAAARLRVRSGAPGEAPQEAGDLFRARSPRAGAFSWSPSRTGGRAGSSSARARRGADGAGGLRPALALEPAHFIMEEGMLRGIRDRAERAASRG